jgi:hypothetical protein
MEASQPTQNGGVSDPLKGAGGAVLSALGVLQALLTTLGAVNGGFSAVLINNPLGFFAGLTAVVLGFALGAYCVVRGKAGRGVNRLAGVAGLLLLCGLLGTAYAAIKAPSEASDPTVNISLTGGDHPELHVSVAATGIPRNATLQVEVERLRIGPDGYFHSVPPSLYHAELGANLQGNVATTISMPIPRASRQYSTINVEAWTGSQHHFCGFPKTPAAMPTLTTSSNRATDEGCALVRVSET